jgi:hypothetical protein
MADGVSGATRAQGWYGDPWAVEQLRWWDGQAWTGHASSPTTKPSGGDALRFTPGSQPRPHQNVVMHGSSKEGRRRLAAANEQDWLAFPGLPGRHLTWEKGGRGSWALVSPDSAIWATRRNQSIFVSGRNYQIDFIRDPGPKRRFSSQKRAWCLVDSTVNSAWLGPG